MKTKPRWTDEDFELDAIGEDGEQFPLRRKPIPLRLSAFA